MPVYKLATKVDDGGEIRLSGLPFRAGEEVLIIILNKEPVADSDQEMFEALKEQLPPVTRRLLGIAQEGTEDDYQSYLEGKHR